MTTTGPHRGFYESRPTRDYGRRGKTLSNRFQIILGVKLRTCSVTLYSIGVIYSVREVPVSPLFELLSTVLHFSELKGEDLLSEIKLQ